MCYPIVPRLGAFNAPNNFISHSHESFLHKMIEYIDGTLFDWGRAIDYAAQWIDYSKCSPEVKKGADRVKGAVDRVNVVFSGCATASAVHNLLDADDNSVGVAEVTAVLSSGAEFLDRLEGLGAIKLAEGASPALAGIGAVADVVGGSYDCAGVLWDKHVKASDSEGLAQAKKSI